MIKKRFIKKFSKTLIGVGLMITFTAVPTFASSAFVGGLNEFSASRELEGAAINAFKKRNITPILYHDFTESNIKNTVASVGSFYANSHGNTFGSSALLLSTKDGNITSDEMSYYANGYYKFVFMDTCCSANRNSWARAFNINGTSDGNLMLGWKGDAWTSSEYVNYTKDLFNQLGTMGATYGQAMYHAYLQTGNGKYGYFGDTNGRL